MASRDSKGRFKQGQSGNPAGRPAKADALRKLLEGDADSVARKVLEAAKQGDLRAAELVLARCSPIKRPSQEPVQFALDDTQPLADQGRAILSAIASGALPPDTGKQLIDSLAALVKVVEVEEFDRRLRAIEKRHGEDKNGS